MVDPTGMTAESPNDIVFNAVDADGNKTELGRIVTDKVDKEININEESLPISVSENFYPVTENLQSDDCACEKFNKIINDTGLQAASLDITGEAAFKVDGQIEISLIGIMSGANQGDWGVAIQGNVLVGLEGSVTGSASVYWNTGGGDLSLTDLSGMEIGVQGSALGVGAAYFQGFDWKRPFAKPAYRGVSLGVSGGIPELGGSGSGYIGGSNYIYRSDKGSDGWFHKWF